MRGLGVGGLQHREISIGWSLAAAVAVGGALGLTLPIIVSPPPKQPPAVATAGVEAERTPASIVRLHYGLLVDLRDRDLGRLLEAPADFEAMDSLVRIQRHLAADNPTLLRSAAAVYARALRDGKHTGEHLTAPAMRLLLLANLLAATQIETQRNTLGPVNRAPSLTVRAGLPLQPPRRVTGPLEPRSKVVPHDGYFLVLSAPLTIQQAQVNGSALASAGILPLLRRFGDGRVQLQVGAFASKANADALAARVRQGGRGVEVSVVTGPRESAIVHVNPTPSPAAGPTPAGRGATFDDLMTCGIRLYGNGWLGPALGSFRRATAVRPTSARAYLWWGRAAFKASRPREARRALERAVALSGDSGVVQEAESLLQIIRVTVSAPTPLGTD